MILGGVEVDGQDAVPQRLFEACTDGLLVAEPDDRCVELNLPALELLGAPREALLGRPVTELLTSAGAKVEATRLPLRDGKSITFLREHGASTRLTRRQFEFMVERASEEIYLVHRDGTLGYVNEAAARSLGYSREELLALGPGPARPFAEHLESLWALPGLPFEATHLSRDGRRLQKEINAVPFELEGVETVCAFGRDVTLRKRAEADLRHVSRLYALLSRINHTMAHVPDRAALFESACRSAIEFGFHMAWVGLLGSDGLVRPVAQAGQVAGYLDDVRIDIRSDALSRGPTGVAVREGRLDVCADFRAEARMKPWQGAVDRGYIASAAIPLRTRGRVVGALSLYSAEPGFFTEQECQLLRQVGENLSFALDGFQSMVERQLLGTQLDRARKLESVGRLAGGVAHDFNNLLTVILASLDASLELVGSDHPAHEALQDGRDAARRSAALTRQLLTVARQQPRSLNALDLNDAVAGARKLLDRLTGEGVTLVWRPGPALWPVSADPSQVDQLLTNLCANARDAVCASGTITLSTANVTLDEASGSALMLAPGDWVTLAVKDDGVGMSPEVLGQLFEPFFTTKAPGKGTGLGLATVYGIVKQNGGHVTVESTPGCGSLFTIYFQRF